MDEEDESYWDEVMEKTPGEFFVEHILMTLLGIAVVALLILVITGSLWLSAKMAGDMWSMLS